MLCGPSCCQLGTDIVQQLSDLAHLFLCLSLSAVRAAAGAWSPAGGGAEASRAADPAHERETVSVD